MTESFLLFVGKRASAKSWSEYISHTALNSLSEYVPPRNAYTEFQSITDILHHCPSLTHISLSAIPAFLRPEIQDLRRPVPEDFTPEQRNTFAVFSGTGVHRLKSALWQIAGDQNAFPDAEWGQVVTYNG